MKELEQDNTSVLKNGWSPAADMNSKATSQEDFRETSIEDKASIQAINQSPQVIQAKMIHELANSSPVQRTEDEHGNPQTAEPDISQFLNTEDVVKEFVTEEHMHAISIYCKRNNIILSCRDTGSLSLDRINQGAKPKPHSILEKSIKGSSLAKAHGEATEALNNGDTSKVNIGGVALDDLKGFVGHWGKDGQLLGVRVDARDVIKAGSDRSSLGSDASAHEKGIHDLQVFLSGKDTSSPYIPLHFFKAYKQAMGSSWQQFLYTGDYDLHELYKNNKTLMEGSREKARALSGINRTIAHEQKKSEDLGAMKLPMRSGQIDVHHHEAEIREGKHKRTVDASTLHASEESQYAMIQHGDQMGYITNQIHEGRLKKESLPNKAQLVAPVASESPGPLAWCARGTWYVTQNKEEHAMLRKGLAIAASSAWSDQAQSKIHSGQSRAMELISGSPSKRGTKKGEDKPWRRGVKPFSLE